LIAISLASAAIAPRSRKALAMTHAPLSITVSYNPVMLSGRLERLGEASSSIWERLQARAVSDQPNAILTEAAIELAWPKILGIIRDFGTRA
jgi:hypothetical protein